LVKFVFYFLFFGFGVAEPSNAKMAVVSYSMTKIGEKFLLNLGKEMRFSEAAVSAS